MRRMPRPCFGRLGEKVTNLEDAVVVAESLIPASEGGARDQLYAGLARDLLTCAIFSLHSHFGDSWRLSDLASAVTSRDSLERVLRMTSEGRDSFARCVGGMPPETLPQVIEVLRTCFGDT